ncbi:hypothetical protein [Cyclobacterium sp.]|uniref:hypothetical protein n=1 Tax=Cyclobacterium sp. TaxID=1966343 RepID=UPI0019C1D5C5|nr:hypothetical protein [Cyclobacterium sp.]MBD3627347.1 hypothetical protein [Cyclobacterium sp.]
MGFIPIFISLGGFVFLFVILVHYNLLQKRKNMQTALQQISGLMGDLGMGKTDEHQNSFPVIDLSKAERLFREMRNSPRTANDPERTNLLEEKILQAKRIRYEYNKLLKTKPYSFVAKLLGHRDI